MKRIIGFAPWGNPLDDPRLDDESFHQQAARIDRLLREVLPDGSDDGESMPLDTRNTRPDSREPAR
jgi:hypothetical protein